MSNPRNKKSIPATRYQETQPPEWEAFLKDVTVERDYHEQPFDPGIIGKLKCYGSMNEIMNLRLGEHSEALAGHQLELVKKIVDRKLKGLTRECMLLMLSTSYSQSRIANLLQTSEDSVARGIKRGIQVVRKCLNAKSTGFYPVQHGTRPPLRVRVFPLDTNHEQQIFQEFLNNETVLHLSYRGDDIFREVMVVYLTGKAKNTVQNLAAAG